MNLLRYEAAAKAAAANPEEWTRQPAHMAPEGFF